MCCPPNMTYVTNGPACPKTCVYPEGDPDCPMQYVEGCQCPAHLVQDIGEDGSVKCVKREECSVCELDGRIFKEGEEIEYECKIWYAIVVSFCLFVLSFAVFSFQTQKISSPVSILAGRNFAEAFNMENLAYCF